VGERVGGRAALDERSAQDAVTRFVQLSDTETMVTLRETREQKERRRAAEVKSRYASERRMQLTALLVLAAAVLIGTVLYAGVRNVFLPGWWRLW